MIWAWLGVAIWVAIVIALNRKTHPKALFALFMVELWERFSYYGMRAILVLYMTSTLIKGGFGFDDARAFGTYAAYGALVYLTPILGGYFADKMMGFRKAIIWGSILMALGQFTLFLDNQLTFYIGLALLVVGNGFFKPNISSMIGKFYRNGDPRRDGAFTIFYMGINIGAFLTPLTCGAIGEIEGWRYGFLAAGIGMVLGLLIYILAQSQGWLTTDVDETGEPMAAGASRPIGIVPAEAATTSTFGIPNTLMPYLASALMVALSWILIKNDTIVDYLLAIIASGIIIYILVLSNKYDKVARQRIWVILLLLLFTTVFWTFFELAGSALNLFTDRNVNRSLFGLEIPTTFFQSVNPLFIMIFAPIFSFLWISLSNAGKEPSAPYKFGIGLLLLGAGFLVLNVGKATAVAGLVPAIFLVLLYLLHTLGELTISPVGLSLVTKLAPGHIVAFLMGTWFLSSSIAHQAGKHIAKLTTIDETKIVAGANFQGCYNEPTIKKAMDGGTFIVDGKGLEGSLIDSGFVAKLNTMTGDSVPRYFAGKIQVQELKQKAEAMAIESVRNDELSKSYINFLTNDSRFAANEAPVVPKAEAAKIYETSLTGGVVNCLKNDSLLLSLGVFRLLGFVAIGCGLLLFLLGPVVSRWMHGIK
jgi:POT family proton-dependent oligopeptide transporter